MFKYKIRMVNSRRKFPEVVFEDERYALVGEMLLSERSFLTQIIEALELGLGGEEAESFSGNAFSLYITEETTKISNDITGEETEAPTKELKKLAKAYKKQYDKVQR